MAIQRAIAKGTVGSVVQIRSMYTCDVVEVGSDDSDTLWGAYMSSMFDAITGLLHNSVTFYEYEVQEYSNGQWIPMDVVTVSETGTGTGDALPNAVSLVLIGVATGLRHLGRKFVGALPEAMTAGNLVVGEYIAGAAAALLAYITPFEGLSGGTITPGVVDENGGFHEFVGGTVSSLLGSMRRRKPGLGI